MTIKINNFKQGDITNCSLPVITGEVIVGSESEILVENQCANSSSYWPVINGKFKVLVNLIPGDNIINLKCGSSIFKLRIVYKYLNFKKFVRLVYIVCCDDDGLFQAPQTEENSVKSACDRICLGAQMLQTFTACKLAEHGLDGKTFCLEEKDGQPICHVFKSSLSVHEARKMSEEKLWVHFATELMRSYLRIGNDCKFLGFLSFTRYKCTLNEPASYKEILGMTEGHVALGGGGLALFGSACLHTWPSALHEVAWRFGDCRKIDRMKLMDDSANRGWYWACYATGLGAALHELGHTFDLGHTNEGIMARGFDDIHKFFIVDIFYVRQQYHKKCNPYYKDSVFEPQLNVNVTLSSTVSWSSKRSSLDKSHSVHVQNIKKYVGNESSVKKIPIKKPPWRIPHIPEAASYKSSSLSDISKAFWCRSSALILYYHKWFNDFHSSSSSNNISISGTKISSPDGIRLVEFRNLEGTAFHHLEYLDDDGKKDLDLIFSDSDLNLLEEVDEAQIHMQDSVGNICLKDFSVVRKDSQLLFCEKGKLKTVL